MATVTIYGNTNDGFISSSSTTYLTARSGGGSFSTDTSSTTFNVGETYNGITSTYTLYEGFIEFSTSAANIVSATSATLDLYLDTRSITNSQTFYVRQRDWGGTVTTADWVSGGSLSALTLAASYPFTTSTAVGAITFTSAAGMPGTINTTGPTRYVVSSGYVESGTSSTQTQYLVFRSGDYSGTTNQPKLTVTGTIATSSTFSGDAYIGKTFSSTVTGTANVKSLGVANNVKADGTVAPTNRAKYVTASTSGYVTVGAYNTDPKIASVYRSGDLIASGLTNTTYVDYDAPLNSGMTYRIDERQNYAGTVMGTSGLVGYWRMSDSSSNVRTYWLRDVRITVYGTPTTFADYSGNGLDLTVSGAPYPAGSSLLASDTDGAMSFTGSGSNGSSTSNLLKITGDVTVEAWVKIGSYTSNAANSGGEQIVRSGDGTAETFGFGINPTGTLAFSWVNSGTVNYAASTGTVSLANATHVAVTRSGTTVTYYINGSSAGTSTVTSATGAGGTFRIGSGGTTGTQFYGTIDEVAVYKRALTSTEIAAHYTSGTTALASTTYSNVTISVDDWMLVGPFGSLVVQASDATYARVDQTESFMVLGANYKRVQRGGVLGANVQLTAVVDSTVRDATVALVRSAAESYRPVYLKDPFGSVWQGTLGAIGIEYLPSGHVNLNLTFTEVS